MQVETISTKYQLVFFKKLVQLMKSEKNTHKSNLIPSPKSFKLESPLLGKGENKVVENLIFFNDATIENSVSGT
jgi:hypothetical protein